MPTESFLVTALPHSAAPAGEFHVSLFITHRLTPDGAVGVLKDFPLTRAWTAALAHATFRLRGGTAGGAVLDIPATPLLHRLDASLWPRVFPGDLPVRPWQVPNHTAAPWSSFPAHRMQQHALLVHAASILSSPTEPPRVDRNAASILLLGALGLSTRELRLSRVIDGEHDHAISKQLDALTAHRGMGGSTAPTSTQQPLLQLVTDVHLARRYYQRAEEQSPYQDRPTAGATATPVPKPTPDFHERVGLLGDLSPLLRKLGLVIDLRLDDLTPLPKLVWIQAEIAMPRFSNPQGVQPRTACRAAAETFTAVSASGDYELGMLKLGDEARYTVLDLDPDASALKLEQYARTLPRLAAAQSNGDPVNAAPSTLRATGFAVARIDGAQQLHHRVSGAAAKDAALRAGTAPPLSLEQINRGVRLEVWDDASGKWHSLHQRLLTVEVEGAGNVLDAEPDTGFLQSSTVSQSDPAPNAPKYAHEVMAGWDGWSLSAPRPGKVVVHENGEELVLDAPPPDPSPVNPVASASEIAPGTLPRLRYGRSYAFRAYAVDLAGNSRPHIVEGGPAFSGLGGPGPTRSTRPVTNVNRIPSRPAPLTATTPVIDVAALAVPEISAYTATRLQRVQRDATRAQRGDPAVDAIRGALQTLRPPPQDGPSPDRAVAGVDPAGIQATGNSALDTLITARVTARLQRAAQRGPTRSQQVDIAFTAGAAQSPYLMERTELQLAPDIAATALHTMLAQQTGLNVTPALNVTQLLAIVSDLITTPRPFLRWDPVIEPAVVPRYAYTEGESLVRLVIRSGVTQAAAGDPDVAITAPADYVAATNAQHPTLALAWREDSQRHLAPPKTSQFEAELHGMFDSAFGASAAAAAVRNALGVALRESGSFLDVTVADIANPGQRVAQPGVTFHVTPTAEVPDVADPANLPDGDPLSPGQYVAHDVDELVLPYLPDPIADGVSFVFPDAGKDHRLAALFAVEGITLRYPGNWPERVPFRLVLETGTELNAEVEDHVIRIMLPPGEQLRMRMASAIARDSLDLLGLWRSLPQPIRDNPILREAAADGWFWWLTPATEVRLVHAVPRPVEVPRITIMLPVRAPGDTAVVLYGAIDLHGPSTDRIDVEAAWTQWVDDVAKPGPEQVNTIAVACGTEIGYDEDLVVLWSTDTTLPLPDGSQLRLHGAVHQTGDTQHRMINYRVRATTRYREYFPPQVTPDIDALSVVSAVRTLDVPSSARPRKVIVRDVLPLFRWDEQTEPAQPFGLRRTRRAGVRIYLERPWYSTGDGELLGVIVAMGSDAGVHGAVSQWGGDPVFLQQGPAQRGVLPLIDLLHLTGLDDRIEAARPVGPPATLTLVDRQGNPAVFVLGYRPEYSLERGLWFVDVALDPGAAFWPFVQFAVARYQPSSLPGLHLGPVTMCDFVQLAPERTATLSRTDETHVRVVVTGPVGHPRRPHSTVGGIAGQSFLAEVAASRIMRARLEQLDPAIATDLGWVTQRQVDLPILGIDGTIVSWASEIELPLAIPPRTPGTNLEWRVTLEEWEMLPADFGAGGTGGWEPRVIYADHLPL